MHTLNAGKETLPTTSDPIQVKSTHPSTGNGHVLDKLLRTLRVQKVTTVTIEAGHIYADRTPDDEQKSGFAVAEEVGKHLAMGGIMLRRIVFIDDYNVAAGKNGFDLGGYLKCAHEHGFLPDDIFWESEMGESAQKLIETLARNGSVTNGEQNELLTARHSIRLRHADGRLACAVLDTAFHLDRFRRFGFNVTILPGRSAQFAEHCYKKEQRNLRRLLRLLGENHPPLATVFFDAERAIQIVH